MRHDATREAEALDTVREPVLLSPAKLKVRCFVELKGDQWQAFSVEFGLAAQAETRHDAMRKLEDMVSSYVYDALVGPDKKHAEALLARKAIAEVLIKYHLYRVLSLIRKKPARKNGSAYVAPLPLYPDHCVV